MGTKSRNKWSQRGVTQPQQSQIEVNQVQYSGPLPPPAMLERYNQAFPGCAERIVALAEKQSDHRQTLERTKINSDIKSERIGTVLGFILVMTAILGGVYLILHDKDTSGLVSILGSLVTLAGVFIYGRQAQRKERDAKTKAN